MAEFSLDLNEDQIQLQKWIHEFGVDVIRPAAEESDEREEFPFPIVQQAAEIGLYGWEFMAEAMMNDPTGLTMVVAIEELFWADAGIGMAIMGSGLAAAGIMVPHIRSLEDAKRVIQMTRFYLLGMRAVDGGHADNGFYAEDLLSYFETANRERFVVLQIESEPVLDELDGLEQVREPLQGQVLTL